MAQGIHTEQTFETAIEESLLTNDGYIKGFSKDISPKLVVQESSSINFSD
jgi:type I restriction enzyme R subunit